MIYLYKSDRCDYIYVNILYILYIMYIMLIIYIYIYIYMTKY